MEVHLFINQRAKKYIKKMVKNKIELQSKFTERWLEETRNVKCYVLVDKENIINIILLSKMDFDPQKKHSTPFMLDYIYTFLEYRKQTFAYKMLLYLKKKEQITACCLNEESANLFKKADYLFTEYGGPTQLFRFP